MTSASLPLWVRGAEPPARRRALTTDARADVTVVGGGIAGMTTAFMLRKAGFRVILLDDGPIGGGETERTTAHLSNALDETYVELERMHDLEGARLAAESHTEAISRIERLVDDLKIDCNFTWLDGWLFNPPGETGDVLSHELFAARRAGLAVEFHKRIPNMSFDSGPAIRFPRQAQVHPLKYLRGLENAFIRDGGTIHTGTHADRIEGGSRPHVVTSEGHVVSSAAIVVATNSPVNDRVALHTKQSAYRTFVVAMRMPASSIPLALMWDTADPYHYVRVQRGRGTDDILIVGGEDHRTGEAIEGDARFHALAAWARERFPVDDVVASWSGQVMEPADGLAFIGADPAGADNVFIATGDSGHGMTHGTIAGLLLTDLILGVENPWSKLYDPKRKPTGALSTYVSENLKNAAHYADYVRPTHAPAVEDIPAGGGAVARKGLLPVAICRDDAGELWTCSAVCPHLGGMVMWNGTERSFDCPLHGSRFDGRGHVMNGPANVDLQPVDDLAAETIPLLTVEPLKEV